MSGARYLGENLSRRKKLTYILVLGTLTALGPFTTDMYLPAFPAIQQQFGVSEADVQLTLTGTMVGFAVGQLLIGPLSDKIGRKPPLVACAALHIGASVGAAVAPSIIWLGVFRVGMGFGAAASGVVSTAMVRDLFGGRPLVKMMSRLALVNGLAPVIAPIAGSQLLAVMNWQGIFWVLASYGALVTVAAMVFIRETLTPEKRKASGRSFADRYRVLFGDRVYVGMLVMAGMNFTGLFAYLQTSPFLFQDVYGMSEQGYGLLFAVNSLAVIIGVQTSSRLMHLGVLKPQWILATTTSAQIILGSLMVVFDVVGLGFWGIAVPLWFFILACGFTFPTVQIVALAEHGEEAGTAASLVGATNFGMAGILSPIIGLFGVTNAVPMGGMIVIAATISATVLWLVVRPKTLDVL